MKAMVISLKVIFYSTCLVLFAWVMLSYHDIIADNSYPNPVHHPWNFFVVTMDD